MKELCYKISKADQAKMVNIIGMLRSVMYSSAEEGNENFFSETEELGKMLGEFDSVPYDRDKNRLTQALLKVKRFSYQFACKEWRSLNT